MLTEEKQRLLESLEKSLNRTDSGNFSHISPAEQEKLASLTIKLRDELSSLLPSYYADEPDYFLLRYLRANKLKLKKTINHLRRAATMRKDYAMDDLTIDKIASCLRQLAFLPLGVNQYGSPTFVCRLKDVQYKELGMYFSTISWLYLLEITQRMHPTCLAPVTLILDCKDAHLRQFMPKPALLMAIRTEFRNHAVTKTMFPRWGRGPVIVCNPSRSLKYVIKAVIPLEPGQYDEIDGKRSYDVFRLLFTSDEIPTTYGGSKVLDIDRFIAERKRVECPDRPLTGVHRIAKSALKHYPKKERMRLQEPEQPHPTPGLRAPPADSFEIGSPATPDVPEWVDKQTREEGEESVPPIETVVDVVSPTA
ncbi:CRAL/TRIO N-terminal domain [Carpediemonas membranifera]|uniref:CRAL/TRIO N-terminal domain n=1 Tax=Carpediemonas membranifera TaxID=201153 RepID=A0A8J6E161_9EUKA|nr:CRAL/TRIO N-terminal domain [Carpediemonas membranifera]|eukprot:KAG9395934.1 CRAL/TRIO N-terminal domain [Carpediemonas membranifera]